jgi:hypothetical protein
MKSDVKLRHQVEVILGGAGQAEPGQCVVERILNGLEGATLQDGIEQPIPSPGMGRPTGIDSRTERGTVDADHRQRGSRDARNRYPVSSRHRQKDRQYSQERGLAHDGVVRLARQGISERVVLALQWADEQADDVVSPGCQPPELLSAWQPGVEIRIVVVDIIRQRLECHGM